MEAQANPSVSRIAVVIPAYRVKASILGVISRIGPNVAKIFVVDDACPEGTGKYVEVSCRDPRVEVVKHERNQGVGGAVMTGYRRASAEGYDVIVKLDGDGQMDPALIPQFIEPILSGKADYTKGNRFYRIESLKGMPALRLFGNASLSFITKIASGYYQLFDPTNGYTAIHADVVRRLPLDKISRRFFFESDMLFRLSTVGAVVVDVPMDAHYADETSSLHVREIFWEFLAGNTRNFLKRVFYNYFLRDFNPASVQLLASLALLAFGTSFGIWKWIESARTGLTASSGTVMLAALPVVLGVQFLTSFLSYDFQNVPRYPIHGRGTKLVESASAGKIAGSVLGEMRLEPSES